MEQITNNMRRSLLATAIGPDLDELRPSKDVILKVMKEGMGAMPSFAETMSEEDMEAVADYVVSVTGG